MPDIQVGTTDTSHDELLLSMAVNNNCNHGGWFISPSVRPAVVTVFPHPYGYCKSDDRTNLCIQWSTRLLPILLREGDIYYFLLRFCCFSSHPPSSFLSYTITNYPWHTQRLQLVKSLLHFLGGYGTSVMFRCCVVNLLNWVIEKIYTWTESNNTLTSQSMLTCYTDY